MPDTLIVELFPMGVVLNDAIVLPVERFVIFILLLAVAQLELRDSNEPEK